jgi:hypothetical protein
MIKCWKLDSTNALKRLQTMSLLLSGQAETFFKEK